MNITIEDVKKEFKNINLNDYDLGGCEISEDDYLVIIERTKKDNKCIKKIIEEYLYEIRTILDMEI